jgi:hypothetical protein
MGRANFAKWRNSATSLRSANTLREMNAAIWEISPTDGNCRIAVVYALARG